MIETRTGADEVMTLLSKGWTAEMVAILLTISESEIEEIIAERRDDSGR